MISFIKEVFRYFFPKRKFRRVPRQIINIYEQRGITEQEQLLMLANAARSPDSAQELFSKYDTRKAQDVLKHLPKKRGVSFKIRLIRLIRKIEGHQTGNPYGDDKDDNRIQSNRSKMQW